MKKHRMINKMITIRKDQEEWLSGYGKYINLSALTQRAIDEEIKRNEK